LVTEVKDSSLTILHQIYSVTGGFHRFRERRCASVGVSAGGAHHLRKGNSFFFEEVRSTTNLVLEAISITIAPFCSHCGRISLAGLFVVVLGGFLKGGATLP
jgi:hypothetical protein